MVGNQGYAGYQIQQAYPQQVYRPLYPQPMQMGMQQMEPGMINARYVTCREEAVAAQIIPDGNAYYFICEAQGRIYCKRYNPQTNAPEFIEYARTQQQTPEHQYAPMDAVKALSQRVEQIEQLLTAPTMRQKEAGTE